MTAKLAIVQNQPPAASTNWQSLIYVGYGFIGCVLGIFFIWAFLARLDGAALAQGVVSVESNRKSLQHLEGGIVRAIMVRDGDLVNQGQVLVRLDPTRTDSAGDLYRTQLAAAVAQETRLLAEREMASDITFPKEVTELSEEPAVARAISDQRRQFAVRRDVLLQTIEVANAQIVQAEKEAQQNDTDNATSRSILENINRELEAVRGLYEKNLVALPRLSTLQREKLRLEGVIQNRETGKVKLQEKIQELTVRRDKAAQDYRQEAAGQLADIRKSINELRQQLIVATDSQQRVELRAPITGVVQQMRVFTIGGVVRPGEPILDIVPTSDSLIVKAKVYPIDADRVHLDMDAEIRFPSFRTLGLQIIRGKIAAMSRDRLIDEITKEPYFDAQVKVDRKDLPADLVTKLSAGMPAEVVIPTGERTVFNYLVTPILERFQTSMRER
jgi:HlyD family type I secretion membrane fusion protein